MINVDDTVYKAHSDCNTVIKDFVDRKGTLRSRLYCCDHNKWLFTLKVYESDYLKDTSPELFDINDC